MTLDTTSASAAWIRALTHITGPGCDEDYSKPVPADFGGAVQLFQGPLATWDEPEGDGFGYMVYAHLVRGANGKLGILVYRSLYKPRNAVTGCGREHLYALGNIPAEVERSIAEALAE